MIVVEAEIRENKKFFEAVRFFLEITRIEIPIGTSSISRVLTNGYKTE